MADTHALPTLVPPVELGQLSPSELYVRSKLQGNIASLDPKYQAVAEDPFLDDFIRTHRGEGTSRAFYNCDFLLECFRIRLVPEISELIENPRIFDAALLFQRFGYTPRKARTKWRQETVTFMSQRYIFKENKRALFSYLKAVKANIFPMKPHGYCGADRDLLWDIALHYFGLPEEEFESCWRRRLQEHQFVFGDRDGAIAFKIFSKNRFARMSAQIRKSGSIFRSEYFRESCGDVSNQNIERKLDSLRGNSSV